MPPPPIIFYSTLKILKNGDFICKGTWSDPGSDPGSDLGSDPGSDHGSEAIRFQSRYRKYLGSDFSAQIATDLTATGGDLRERSDRYRLKVGPADFKGRRFLKKIFHFPRKFLLEQRWKFCVSKYLKNDPLPPSPLNWWNWHAEKSNVIRKFQNIKMGGA